LATTDDSINGLQFYICERLIGIAEILAREFANEHSTSPLKESGYAILSIVSAYFEMVEQLSTGTHSDGGKSREFFVRGFRKVYPCFGGSNKQIEDIYGRIRCGMYHNGMTREGTVLSRDYKCGFQICGTEIRINPALVVEDVKRHFCCVFLQRLRDPCSCERQQFAKMAPGLGLEMSPTTSTTTTRGTQNPADNSSYQ
jgi:hypothetical protein